MSHPHLVDPSTSSSKSPHSPSSLARSLDTGLTKDQVDERFSAVDASDTKTYVLVVGGLGYIGSHTVLELLKADYNVIVLDDLSNAYLTVFHRVQSLASEYFSTEKRAMPVLKLHETDYRSPAVKSLLAQYAIPSSSEHEKPKSRIAGVIHFAAFKSVEESIRQPLRYYSNNISGLIDFTSTLEEFGIKTFVFSSSATVYGSVANNGVPLKEDHCSHHPIPTTDDSGQQTTIPPSVSGLTSPYGRTKWMAEAILSDLAVSDPSWSIAALRYFNPVGCHESGLLGDDPRQVPTNLIPVIANVMRGKSAALKIFGTDWDTSDGTAVRDFIHVVDLARGHIFALAAAIGGKIQGSFRTFNLGSGQGHSVCEVLASLEKASGMTIPAERVGRRDGDVGFCVAEATRAKEELGWCTEKSLDDSARDVWNFMQVEQQQGSSNEAGSSAKE
ncbi:related to UDP-glucose 4-epimerase [Rhynchosporium agropyri]|uniref:Related to UDP-glucose 4-epimerase n=1 Tax=Rhynchosporium agropyri TaxID=914238 RepID=A0A1E1L9P9_9HELO|nr:related to UDP-glucose 4-epimerase [Rhynchosporium agropyri]